MRWHDTLRAVSAHGAAQTGHALSAARFILVMVNWATAANTTLLIARSGVTVRTSSAVYASMLRCSIDHTHRNHLTACWADKDMFDVAVLLFVSSGGRSGPAVRASAANARATHSNVFTFRTCHATTLAHIILEFTSSAFCAGAGATDRFGT